MLALKTVRSFPQLFRGLDNANIVRAMRLWSERKSFKDEKFDLLKREITSTVARVSSKGMNTVQLQTCTGRRRKRAKWLEALHASVTSEFDHLRELSVNFNHHTLRMRKMSMLQKSENDSYTTHMTDPRSGKMLMDEIDAR